MCFMDEQTKNKPFFGNVSRKMAHYREYGAL